MTLTHPGHGASTGEVLGPYLLLGRVGEGGMGVVHRASAPDGGTVAVKVLRPGVLAGDDARARLAREVAALQRVRGPGVAEVLDADVSGDRPYVVTRFVVGCSLDRFVDARGPLGPVLQRRLASGLADALAAVHAAGVVHRDVKPGNVMLTDGGRVVLIDFGLARAVDATRLTNTGVLVGTPGYLAPETVVGHVPTAATDVHGWAATLAYAASGVAPYGEGPVVAVLDRIRRGEHALRGLDPTLEGLVRAGLSDDPARRPALADLRSALGAPVTRRGAEPAAAAPTTAVLALEPRTRVDLPVQPPWGTFPFPPADPVRPVPVAPTGARPATGEPLALPAHPQPGYAQPAHAQPAHTQPGYAQPGQVAPWPGAALVEPPRARGLPRAVLVAVAALVVLGIAVAPYVALLALAGALLVARTTDRLRWQLLRRRLGRGQRPHDVRAVALQAPWRALLCLPATLLQTVWVTLSAGAAGGVATVVTSWSHAPLYAAGVAAAATAWWGPGSGSIRRGARTGVRPLRRGGAPVWTLVALLFAVAWGLAVVAEQYAALWWPAAGGPGVPTFGPF